MAVGGTRDLEAVRLGLERWFRHERPDFPGAIVSPIERPSAGLSSDTVVFEVTAAVPGAPGGWQRSWFVARLPPAGDGLFPHYDLSRQAALQTALARAGLGAVEPLAMVDDPSFVGAPFLLMPRVPGRTIATDRPYLREGWLADAGPQLQARLHGAVLDAMAALHRLDVGELAGLLPVPSGAALEGELLRWGSYLEWAAGGTVPPALAKGLAWCSRHRPAVEPRPSVLWGDAQLGNAVFADDGSVVALLDFELAGVGPAELDLGWFTALHEMTVARCGTDLPGFPDRAATIAGYEARLGRGVDDLRWYEAFAALRSSAVVLRAARLLALQGLDPGWAEDPATNPALALLDRLTS